MPLDSVRTPGGATVHFHSGWSQVRVSMIVCAFVHNLSRVFHRGCQHNAIPAMLQTTNTAVSSAKTRQKTSRTEYPAKRGMLFRLYRVQAVQA